MIHVICGIDGEQVAFDEGLWGGVLDHIVVKEDGAVVVFKGGLRLRLEHKRWQGDSKSIWMIFLYSKSPHIAVL